MSASTVNALARFAVKGFDMRTLPVPTAGEGRVIEHYTDAVTSHVIMEHVTPVEFYRAIGYLSTWNMTFPHVKLYYNAKEFEITASYYDESGTLGYCIGAVFNDTSRTFGFHS